MLLGSSPSDIHSFLTFISSRYKIYRVTDEALIAEAMVWPNFFLMNVFFALKGSKLFIIIPLPLDAWVGLRYSIVALPEPSM